MSDMRAVRCYSKEYFKKNVESEFFFYTIGGIFL